MRVAIVGAGPAGLYAAYLLKRVFQHADVQVHERRPRGTTFGFGIVFSDKALNFLAAGDPETHALLVPQMERWSDLTIVHMGERIVIDGIGFSAIGRQSFLDLLEARARGAGVDIRYGREADALAGFLEADLVIGADGVNSLVRQAYAGTFGTRLNHLGNRFMQCHWRDNRNTRDTSTPVLSY